MKLLEALEAKRSNRFLRVEIRDTCLPANRDDLFEWVVSATVSARIVGSAEMEDCLKLQARKMIAREIYGEIVNDLYNLKLQLSNECYRAADDDALAAIDAMIDKMVH